MNGHPSLEIPVMHLVAMTIDGRIEMPAVRKLNVVGEFEETLGHTARSTAGTSVCKPRRGEEARSSPLPSAQSLILSGY